MRTHLPAVLLAATAVLFTACGKKAAPCDNVSCPLGKGCDTQTGACVSLRPDDACNQACGGGTPVCDATSRSCKVCTASSGCSGATPVCNTAVSLGACVRCTQDSHCASNERCNLTGNTCVPRTAQDAGAPPPDAGVEQSCNPACSGLYGYCEPQSGVCVACLEDAHCGPGGHCDTALYACSSGQCITPKPAQQCTTACPEGYTCQGGGCVLRGGGGPVQVTLRWDTDTDLDLHVVEPTAQGTCEISYEDPNSLGNPSSCGAVGSLDLDSNAGCAIDHVNVENVIYPAGAGAPSGTYSVSVVNFDPCAVHTTVPFEVTVRANGQVQVYCDSFAPGTTSTSRPISTFNVP